MIYVALLRGINVGGNNKLEMKALKSQFEALGYIKVLTYINSGNIIFEADNSYLPRISKTIEAMIEDKFGLKLKVLVKSLIDLERICTVIPKHYKNDQEMKCDVMFLWEEVDNEESITKLNANPEFDRLQYVPGAIIWSIDKINYNRSSMPKLIGTKLYSLMTVRNVNTTRKLLELMKNIGD